MATPKFSYPDSTAGLYKTSSEFYLKWYLSGGVYGVGKNIDRQIEDIDTLHSNQDIGRTQGGELMVDNYGGAKRRWQFTGHVWVASDAAPDGSPHYYSPHEIDRADVESFIEDYICWAEYPFDWTDVDGTVRTVRLVSPDLEWSAFGLDELWVRFQLEEA